MKIIAALFLLLTIYSCKAKRAWNKENAQNECLREFNKRNDEVKKFSTLQIGLICDCMSTKMIANYKKESDADKDKMGVSNIARDCATEAMTK